MTGTQQAKLIPAPKAPTVDALGEAGDRYVAALAVRVFVHAADRADPIDVVLVPGDRFEAIMTALRLRHLAFHPRTRAFVPNCMKAAGWTRHVDLHWAHLDSYSDEMPEVTAIADAITASARGAHEVSWGLA